MLLLDLNDGLLKQAKVHFQKIVDVEMLCWDGNFDQGYFRFFRIQYHLQIFKMFSYHCVHKVKQKSTSWQSQIYSFFHPLPYFRHSVTNWFCSRQIHDSHTHMLSQFIPAWMLLQSILREEEHKKMASNAVSIKGCSYSSMIHWFVGKRVNLFSASLIIDLRRFFVKMKDLKFLLYFLANGFPPKLRKINK